MNIVRDKWLNVKKESDKVASIKIHGVIGGGFFEDGVTDAQVEQDLEDIKNLKADKIIVDLDSLGGSVKHGMKIHNLLKENPANIEVNITGWTASMGTVIAMAGDTIKMVDNTFFLVHEARTVTWGTQSQLQADANFLKEINDTIANIYSKRTGLSEKEAKELMAVNGGEGEFWNAKTTLDKGFVDSIYSPEKKSRAAAMLTDEQLKNFKIKAKLKTNKMKFNETKIGAAIMGAVKAGLDKLKPEEKTEGNIDELVNTASSLVAETLQTDIDSYKTEQEEKYNALVTEKDEIQGKYDALVAKGSEENGDDAPLNDPKKLSAWDLAAKDYVNQLSETDKILMTNKNK